MELTENTSDMNMLSPTKQPPPEQSIEVTAADEFLAIQQALMEARLDSGRKSQHSSGNKRSGGKYGPEKELSRHERLVMAKRQGGL